MRFICFGDRHNRLTTPENRIDDYQQNTLAKDNEIRALAKTYGASAFLQPGDFLDAASASLEFLAKINGEWEKTGLPVIGVVGNHEEFGNNVRTIDKTAIGFLKNVGNVIQFATKENPIIFKTEDGATVAITGTHYHLEMDTPECIEDYIVREKLADFHIHIVHGYLTDKSKGIIRHTLIDSILETQADLTFTGHDHIGFPITCVDGKYFVNPGAVVRMSADVKEIGRMPKVLLVDITKKDGLKLEEIPLKSALSGKSVLDRTKIEQMKKREVQIESIIQELEKAEVNGGYNITEILADISSRDKIDDSIKTDVVNRVSEKINVMDKSSEDIAQNVYIEKVILENVLSHEHTVLECDKGFNVFIAESGNGKSAVLRAINWVVNNEPSGKGIIRSGASFARVTLFLSSGHIVSRYIESKTNGKNGYYVTDPSGETTFGNTKSMEDVQKLLGYTPFFVDKDIQPSLNYIKQGDGWFLISNRYSGPQKAKIIGAIYGTQYTDAVTRDIEREKNKFAAEISAKEDLVKSLSNREKQFDYLDDMKNRIDSANKHMEEIAKLNLQKERIQTALDNRRKILSAIQTLDSVLKATENILNVRRSFDATNELVGKIKLLEPMIRKRTAFTFAISECDLILEKTSKLNELKAAYARLSSLIDKKDKIETQKVQSEKISQNIQKLNNKIRVCKRFILITDKIGEIYDMFDAISEKSKLIEKIQSIVLKRNACAVGLKKSATIIEIQTGKLSELVESYKKLLRSYGKCPVCFNSIDEHTIEHILKESKENA